MFHEREIQATRYGGHAFLELRPNNPEEVNRYLSEKIGEPYSHFSGHAVMFLSGVNVETSNGVRLVNYANWDVDMLANPRFSQTLMAPICRNAACEYSDDTRFIGNLILGARSYSTLYPDGLPYDGIVGYSAQLDFLRGEGKPLPSLQVGVAINEIVNI